MLFTLEVNIIQPIEMRDGGKLWKLELVDKTKPSTLRSAGRFQRFLTEEAVMALVNKPMELEDETVTIAPSEVTAGGGAVTLKGGQMVMGVVSIDKLTDGRLPEKPTPKPAPKAAA